MKIKHLSRLRSREQRSIVTVARLDGRSQMMLALVLYVACPTLLKAQNRAAQPTPAELGASREQALAKLGEMDDGSRGT